MHQNAGSVSQTEATDCAGANTRTQYCTDGTAQVLHTEGEKGREEQLPSCKNTEEQLTLAMAAAAPGEAERHAAAAAAAPAVVAHVHAGAVGRRVPRVALLHRDRRPARHPRRVVLHPRRPRRRRRRQNHGEHGDEKEEEARWQQAETAVARGGIASSSHGLLN